MKKPLNSCRQNSFNLVWGTAQVYFLNPPDKHYCYTLWAIAASDQQNIPLINYSQQSLLSAHYKYIDEART
jgi:hypothetical protein